MPLFSIITINFNNADGLQQTMESVFAQSLTDYEYIIIDGGSTDESVDKILANKDRFAYYVSEKDAGIYDAMNKGIAVAKGDYCLFLNSGDYFYNAQVLEYVLSTNPTTDIVYGDIMSARDGVILHRTNSPPKVSIPFLLVGVIPHPAQFIRRTLFDEYGKYSTTYKLSSDYAFFVKVFFTGKLSFRHIPIPISIFDLSGISSDPRQVSLFYDERKEIQTKYFPWVYSRLYHVLISIMRSKLVDNPLVKAPVKYLKRIVLAMMGEKKIPSSED